MWDFLDELGVGERDLLFVHSSLKFWTLTPKEAILLIEELIRRVGPQGGLLMPSYYWTGGAGRPPDGAVYDVRRSPSKMGLVTELFRRWPGAERSEAYLAPVCAWGERALPLVEGQAEVEHPFGEGSTFRLAYEHQARVVGLGVSLNTNAMAHLPDMELGDHYPVAMFEDRPVEGLIRDRQGQERRVATVVIREGVRQLYRPSALFEESPALAQSLKRADLGSTIRFSYPLKVYVEEAVRLGRAALDGGDCPPWLSGWPPG